MRRVSGKNRPRENSNVKNIRFGSALTSLKALQFVCLVAGLLVDPVCSTGSDGSAAGESGRLKQHGDGSRVSGN